MSDEQIAASAERVRQVIHADLRRGFGAVVDFANSRAATGKLKHEALLLKFSQHDVTSREELAELGQQMLALVDRIERDHADNWDSQELDQRRRRVSEVQADYLSKPALVQPVFTGRNLCKRYPGFRLQGVDLGLRPGEVAAVVGQNANGKTTLLRIVAGELRHEEGSVSYSLPSDGKRQTWAKIKSHVAYLPQDLPSWSGSLKDNLHYEAALHGIRGEDNEREVEFFIERLGLRPHLDKPWSALSGGFKLRFALARVLIWKPRLLVLDEPLANLDVLAQSRLLQDILHLARSPRYPIAVLMSSQHLHELEAVASSITFLRDGRAIFSGAIADVGTDRRYNVYELGTSSGQGRLKQVFDDPRYEEPFFNGVSYVIKTDVSLEAAAVLQKLLSAGVEVNYFRDISRSIKRLFE